MSGRHAEGRFVDCDVRNNSFANVVARHPTAHTALRAATRLPKVQSRIPPPHTLRLLPGALAFLHWSGWWWVWGEARNAGVWRADARESSSRACGRAVRICSRPDQITLTAIALQVLEHAQPWLHSCNICHGKGAAAAMRGAKICAPIRRCFCGRARQRRLRA